MIFTVKRLIQSRGIAIFSNRLIWGIFLLGIGLRLGLFMNNPPGRGFDNHFEPVFLIMRDNVLPDKDACWECYQPPVFYYISAQVGKLLNAVKTSPYLFLKILQFLPCLFGIASLYIILLIINRFSLTPFARVLAFGFACLLPRHIYMSAIFSNDTISYFFVALSVYLIMVVIDNGRSIFRLIILGIIATVAIFTKSTALAVLPAIGVGFIMAFYQEGRKAVLSSLLFIFFLPSVFLGYSLYQDVSNYGQPLPLNVKLMDVKLEQRPGEGKVSFVSFKPWTTIITPVLSPDNLRSFWTLIYSRMWFDMEPEFINRFSDSNRGWWKRFWRYLNYRSVTDWPGTKGIPLSIHYSGALLIFLGLLPLAMFWLGILMIFRKKWRNRIYSGRKDTDKAAVLFTLFIVNVLGVLIHALSYPVYSFMKASFLLNSLPVFSVFIGKGIMVIEGNRSLRWTVGAIFGLLFILSAAHIVHIALSI